LRVLLAYVALFINVAALQGIKRALIADCRPLSAGWTAGKNREKDEPMWAVLKKYDKTT